MALAVILDMDGVILDTEPISFRAWRQAAQDLGYLLDEEIYERMVGLSQTANTAMLLHCFGDDCPVDALVRSANSLYREALDAHGVPQKPGLLDFIRFLDDRRLPRAVATSTATDLATHKLRRAGVLQHFDVLIGGDQVSRGKPEPDIFLMAASQLHHRPEDCVVLEDSAPGIRAAVAAGMRAILIPDGNEPGEGVRRDAHAVVESLVVARSVIEQIMRQSTLTSGRLPEPGSQRPRIT